MNEQENYCSNNDSCIGDGVEQVMEGLLSDEQYELFNQIMSCVMVAVAFFGSCTNIINIKTFLTIGLKDGVTVSLLFLALVDLGFCLSYLIQSLANVFVTIEETYGYFFSVQPLALRFFAVNISLTLSVVSILDVTFITVARCMCVTMPLQFKNTFTRKRCMYVLSTIFIIVWALHIPIFAHMGIEHRFDPKINASRNMLWMSSQRAEVKDTVRLIAGYVLTLPSVVIDLVCIIIIATKLRQSAKFRRQATVTTDSKEDGGPGKLSDKDIQVIVQILLVCAILLSCNIPKLIINVIQVMKIIPGLEMGQAYQNSYLVMSAFYTFGDAINASFNFFVYFHFNSRFRAIIKNSFKRLLGITGTL